MLRNIQAAVAATAFVGALAMVSPVAVLAQAGQAQGDRAVQRSFPQGGTIHLDLSAGEYEITASPDDSIRVTWNPKDDDVDVIVDVKGSRADVEIDGPRSDGVHVQVQLPRRSNVVISLTAGELEMRGIEGSKDIDVRAGEVRLGVNPSQYRQVNASVRIGELAARAFNVDKGGFFRSFAWTGQGQYDLKAHLTVGEMVLDDR